MKLFAGAQKYFFDLVRIGASGWNEFWFSPAPPHTLAVIRILTGLVVIYTYASSWPHVWESIGPRGWVDNAAYREIVALPTSNQFEGFSARFTGGLTEKLNSRWSVFGWLSTPWMLHAAYACFITATLAMVIGWKTRWSIAAVLVFHLSYLHRAVVSYYGLDVVLSMLLIYLLIGRSGDAWSVDSSSKKNITAPAISNKLAIRLIQVHLCIIYAVAGLSKLQGELWWSGMATYYTIMVPELWPWGLDYRWVAKWDWPLEACINVLTFGTLFFEISFCVLIWQRMLRPLILAMAVMLHGGIGLFMGLDSFSVAMLIACASFVPPAVVQNIETWKPTLAIRRKAKRVIPANAGT